ncbi:MAG: hypothetical protein IJC94_05130 [Oscillospiraceae bacterium]|nr:hypothetical protein [Oscillospiraceae bacterium]
MKSKKHIIIISLMLVLLVLAGCAQTESSSRPPVETPIKPDKETSSVAEDEPIYDEEFVAVLGRNSIATAYDGVSLELINNSDDDIYLTGGDYNVYYKTEEGYVLIDYDSDGKTKTDEYGKKIINSKVTSSFYFYFFQLLPEGVYLKDSLPYIPAGRYKLEIPIPDEEPFSAEIELIEDTVIFDEGIHLEMPQEKYSAKSKEPLTYTVVNNSLKEVDIHGGGETFSRYEKGKWVSLKPVDLTIEMTGTPCPPHTIKKWQCRSLKESVKGRIKPGRYRLEKVIDNKTYFAEFEVY